MLPVTAWPPIRPGYWTSPFGAPAPVNPGPHGFALPKGCWLVTTGPTRVIFIIRPPDPMEPYWRQPGTGIVHGMGPTPDFPTWPDEHRHRTDLPEWPHHGHRSSNPKQDTRHGEYWEPHPEHPIYPFDPAYPPPGPCPPEPCPGPPGTRIEQLLGSNVTGIVFADGQNVRIVGTGQATVIKVFSV